MRATRGALLVLIVAWASSPAAGQTNCGSALLAQAKTPAVFQGITLGGSAVARMWAAGNASQYLNTNPCAVGCANLTASPLCVNNGNCIALTGVNWINMPCPTAGTRPARTVFLVEAQTASSGGVWAALNLGNNSSDANYDLDSKANGSYCTASPYIGGTGQPVVASYRYRRPILTVSLSWQPPLSSAAEALNNSGTSLVTSYAVYSYVGGNPPPSTGSKTNWSRVSDIDATSNAHGYSTGTSAIVNISGVGTTDSVYVAIGLNFDGTGDPDVTGSNTEASTFISAPVLVPFRGR